MEYDQRTIEDLEYDPAKGHIDDAIDYGLVFGPNYTEKREPGLRMSFGINLNWRL